MARKIPYNAMRAPLARNNVSQYEMFILQARDIHHAAFKKTLPKAFFHMPLNVSGKRIRQPQTLDRHARTLLESLHTDHLEQHFGRPQSWFHFSLAQARHALASM